MGARVTSPVAAARAARRRAAASEREAARRGCRCAAGFGMPEGESECEAARRGRCDAATPLARRGAKGAERFRKEWGWTRAHVTRRPLSGQARLNRLESSAPAPLPQAGGEPSGHWQRWRQLRATAIRLWYALAEHDPRRCVVPPRLWELKQILDDTSLTRRGQEHTCDQGPQEVLLQAAEARLRATKARLPIFQGTSSSGPGGGGQGRYPSWRRSRPRRPRPRRRPRRAKSAGGGRGQGRRGRAAAQPRRQPRPRPRPRQGRQQGCGRRRSPLPAPGGAYRRLLPLRLPPPSGAASGASSGSGGPAAPPVKVVSLADLKGAGDDSDDDATARLLLADRLGHGRRRCAPSSPSVSRHETFYTNAETIDFEVWFQVCLFGWFIVENLYFVGSTSDASVPGGCARCGE